MACSVLREYGRVEDGYITQTGTDIFKIFFLQKIKKSWNLSSDIGVFIGIDIAGIRGISE